MPFCLFFLLSPLRNLQLQQKHTISDFSRREREVQLGEISLLLLLIKVVLVAFNKLLLLLLDNRTGVELAEKEGKRIELMLILREMLQLLLLLKSFKYYDSNY